MNATPLVSVIVPTFNRPSMLRDALASIQAQTYREIEVIVVNDGGVDVQPVVDSAGSLHRSLCLKHETTRGLAAARNSGLRAASGEYIAYVDDDDVYYPDHVETLVKFLTHSGAKVAYTDAYQANECPKQNVLSAVMALRSECNPAVLFSFLVSRVVPRGLLPLYRSLAGLTRGSPFPFLKLSQSGVDIFSRCDGKYLVVNRTAKFSCDFDRDTLLVKNYVPVLCVMHHRSCLDGIGWFDESLTTHEDWDLWIRMSRQFVFAHIKKITCEYSRRSDGSNMSTVRHADLKRTMELIYEKYRYLTNDGEIAEAQKRFLSQTFS
jgi:glycosyltransferase involved in cell wall biosynthesis